jgi:hypothetical protein
VRSHVFQISLWDDIVSLPFFSGCLALFVGMRLAVTKNGYQEVALLRTLMVVCKSCSSVTMYTLD